MDADTTPGGSERLQEVLALVRAKIAAPERATIEDLVGRYYGQVDPEDLDERQPADLYGAVLSHWGFARKREPGRAKVRVFNPTIEEHGWQSTHTIIEIVNDDMPFLVDSVTMEANRHGLTLHLIVHPLLAVVRDAGGTLTGLAAEGKDARRESFIHVEVDRTTDAARLDALAADVGRVLLDVRMAVEDWKKMKARLAEIVADLDARPPPLPADELAEGQGLPELAGERPFRAPGLPLSRPRHGRRRGCAAHRRGFGARHPARDRRSRGRGELRRAAAGAAGLRARSATSSSSRRRIRARRCTARAISTTSASSASTRRARSAASTVSSASTRRPRTARSPRRFRSCGARRRTSSRARAWRPEATPARRSRNILETYPRDELLQTRDDDLYATAMGILHLGDRQRFRLFVRRDPFGRFLSCLIFAPRENYTTELRQKWQAILMEAFNGVGCRIQRAPVRVDARAHPHDGPHDARQGAAVRRARTRGAPRGGRAALGGRPARGADRRPGRGARQRALPPVRRRIPGRLPRRFRGARGGARHRADGGAHGRPIRSRCRCIARSRRPRACCASSSSTAAARSRCRTACRCSSGWGSR